MSRGGPGTARPWWVSREAGRRGLAELSVWQRQLQEAVQRLHLQQLADWRMRPDGSAHLYAPGHLRVRLEGIVNRPSGGVAGGSSPTLWQIPDLMVRVSPRASPAPGGDAAGVSAGGGVAGGAGGAGWYSAAARGLPLGAVLLALLLLLVRAADKCLATNFFKFPSRRRRHSEEWPTPSVIATSLAVRIPTELGAREPPSVDSASSPAGDDDLPPPYSECTPSAPATPPHRPKPAEDPPPPYSACYVTYSNPKDQPPSVHLYTRARSNESGSETGHSSRIHNIPPLDSDDDSPPSLYFANGRVLERREAGSAGVAAASARNNTETALVDRSTLIVNIPVDSGANSSVNGDYRA